MPDLDMVRRAEEQLVESLDRLPILAAIIGIRTDEHEAGASTPEETALMDALFKVHQTWLEVRPQAAVTL